MKTCTKCGLVKPLDQFNKFRHAKDGLTPWCKSCTQAQNRDYRERNAEKYRAQRKRDYRENRTARRAANEAWKSANRARHQFLQRRSWLKNIYNITPERYDEMFEEQGGVCAICKQPDSHRLHVDHDHTCCPGKRSCGRCIRGLLCGRCNRLLGWFENNRTVVSDYLNPRERKLECLS